MGNLLWLVLRALFIEIQKMENEYAHQYRIYIYLRITIYLATEYMKEN